MADMVIYGLDPGPIKVAVRYDYLQSATQVFQ